MNSLNNQKIAFIDWRKVFIKGLAISIILFGFTLFFFLSSCKENVSPKSENCDLMICSNERLDSISLSLDGYGVYFNLSNNQYLLTSGENGYLVCNSDILEGIETRKILNAEGKLKKQCLNDVFPTITLSTFEIQDTCVIDYQESVGNYTLFGDWRLIRIENLNSYLYPPCESPFQFFSFRESQISSYSYEFIGTFGINTYNTGFNIQNSILEIDPEYTSSFGIGTTTERNFESYLNKFIFSPDELTYSITNNLLTISNLSKNEKILLVSTI